MSREIRPTFTRHSIALLQFDKKEALCCASARKIQWTIITCLIWLMAPNKGKIWAAVNNWTSQGKQTQSRPRSAQTWMSHKSVIEIFSRLHYSTVGISLLPKFCEPFILLTTCQPSYNRCERGSDKFLKRWFSKGLLPARRLLNKFPNNKRNCSKVERETNEDKINMKSVSANKRRTGWLVFGDDWKWSRGISCTITEFIRQPFYW